MLSVSYYCKGRHWYFSQSTGLHHQTMQPRRVLQCENMQGNNSCQSLFAPYPFNTCVSVCSPMGKPHFLPRTFSHFRQVLKGILRISPSFAASPVSILTAELHQADKASLPSSQSFVITKVMEDGSAFLPQTLNLNSLWYFFVAIFIKKRKKTQPPPHTISLLSLHLGRRRICHQPAFKHLVCTLPHLTKFHSSHLETEKEEKTGRDKILLMISNWLHKLPCSIIFLTAS